MSIISDADLSQFRELGYLVTAPVFSEDELNPIRDAFDELHAEEIATAEAGGDDTLIEYARFRPFIGKAHERKAVLADVVKAPVYIEACTKLIGPDADLYYNQVVIKPPERGRAFAWHQDSGYVLTEPVEYITCWTAINRAFVENGCIWVLPGSHKWGLLPHVQNEAINALEPVFPDGKDDSGAIPVEMAAGQVAIFSSLLLHRSGENTSNEIRRGYVPQYSVPRVTSPTTGELLGDQFPVLRDGTAV